MIKYFILIFFFTAGLIWSAINPHDYFTWILEVFPAITAFIILTVTYKNFQFTFLTYTFILIHCYILFIGGHYTYAEVPFFNTIKEIFDLQRNNYDKIGHFAQGFVPALVVREIFTRMNIVKKGIWLSILTISVCLSISVLYEFLEWFVALVSGQSAEAFLGTQGYAWDTQSDMLFALIGALVMIIFLAPIQDRQIMKIRSV